MYTNVARTKALGLNPKFGSGGDREMHLIIAFTAIIKIRLSDYVNATIAYVILMLTFIMNYDTIINRGKNKRVYPI